MSALAEELTVLLEDVDTAPDESPSLDTALDNLLDWVQSNRQAILERLRAPATQSVPDQRALAAYMTIVEEAQQVTFVPQAVSRRGNAYIPTACPSHMTEALFQDLLEAEAQAAEDKGEDSAAAVLRLDLKRRRDAFAAQERRAVQLAALSPLPGRRIDPPRPGA